MTSFPRVPNDGPTLEDELQFARCLGQALQWWNHVENRLGDVFCALFGGVNNMAARGAYLAVVNFKARLQMVDAAARASSLPEALFARWSKLNDAADRKSKIRNKLTHFSSMNVTDSNGTRAIVLMPNFWTGAEFSKALDGRGIRWTWPEIWNFGQDFADLSAELMKLSLHIESHVRAHPPVYSAVALDLYFDPDTSETR